MTEYLLPLLAALIAVGWCCRRWGIADGYADGYDKGRTKGLLEGKGLAVSIERDGTVTILPAQPSAVGGPGAVPR